MEGQKMNRSLHTPEEEKRFNERDVVCRFFWLGECKHKNYHDISSGLSNGYCFYQCLDYKSVLSEE